MFCTSFLRATTKIQALKPVANTVATRSLSFTFAGPRKLDDILKKELVEDKSSEDITDLWYTYHENQEKSIGLSLNGEEGNKVLERAPTSPFFVQPVFRENGYFMLVSQFQDPAHFLLAYLEDFKMDPQRAQPLMTCSVFDDYASNKDITLVRSDIMNNAIEGEEGRKIVQCLLDAYSDDEEFALVDAFNNNPSEFDLDKLIAMQRGKWDAEASVDVEK
eukprot:Nitzschia sp. Nitz4//scaffold174_size87051//10180//11038//NITZ4_005100-RA/size87051-augustus-gene-0.54-mRNA-1//1//CDS//3329538845//1343//frame0